MSRCARMAGIDRDMAAYYAEGDEAERLQTWGRLERERTLLLLERVLPAPPAAVLDVGGGPGVYALALAARGYAVALMDPIELHVEQARAAGVHDARIGDARELPWPDASVDAVLLLGPLYHLPERADRDRRDRSRVLSRKGTRRRASAPRPRQDRCRAGSAPLAATLPHHPLDHRAAPRPRRSSMGARVRTCGLLEHGLWARPAQGGRMLAQARVPNASLPPRRSTAGRMRRS
jgi:SAM-dependent methyltransferase